ncbi:CDGSH iron-sulfur domain-containing protein 3, mitochondrial [Folsomia candida]|uniref:CDGSH iron-sulfur domain-containing protein 3, mitochondrial n=1 Tax=Folsomia candida TaxID=158441 RepID=A0A226E5C6_FOLCA|nr:CDGSH iron-sulfur domain-containing protein 3, mitochondrial [Folsomia candida]
MWTRPLKKVFAASKFQLIRGQSLQIQCFKSTVAIPSQDLEGVSPSSASQTGFGKIYDKKPFKFRCTEGKSYFWCACGQSKSQPFCDKLCNNTHYKISMRPVKFIPPETKDYWFCNCKQTSKRPFCDGTHRREDVIAAVKI